MSIYIKLLTQKKGVFFSDFLKFLLVTDNSIVQILYFLLTCEILKKKKKRGEIGFTDQTYKKFGALN